MEEYVQVFTTTERKEDAERIARTLVEKRLAGCVQILGPIISTYWWKAKVEASQEWLCIIKSKRNIYEKLEKTIKDMHSYETPEILAMPITAGSESYLKWLSDNTSSR
jgi:periplasmic divalent cation tolerance protein